MEDNFLSPGFDNSNIGIEKYIEEMKKTAKNAASYEEKLSLGKTKLDDLPLTMAYVPMQKLKEKYNEEVALKNGTLFPELDKPFLGKRI